MVPRDRGGGGRRCPWAFVLLVLAAVLDSGTGYRPMRLAPLRVSSASHDGPSPQQAEAAAPVVPPLKAPRRRRVVHCINLTNGLEGLPVLRRLGFEMEDLVFMRLQSTKAEQHDMEYMLAHLDHHVLWNLALGNVVIIYDTGSRGTLMADGSPGVSRALWLGLEWISYSLQRLWKLDARGPGPSARGYNMSAIFDQDFMQLGRGTLKKYHYYRKYLACRRVHLYGACALSKHDGESEPYVQLVREAMAGERQASRRDDVVEVDEALSLDEQDEQVRAAVRALLPPGYRLFLNSDYKLGGTPREDKQRLRKADRRKVRAEGRRAAETAAAAGGPEGVEQQPQPEQSTA